MMKLTGDGTSEVIAHTQYAQDVDSHNILSRIPYLGLRVPLKAFRAWAVLTRHEKFKRAREALAVGALHLRTRYFRLHERVAAILEEVRTRFGDRTHVPWALCDPRAHQPCAPCDH